MASFSIAGDVSGVIKVQGPAVAGTNTITFPAETGTLYTTASTTLLAGQIAWNTTVQTTGFTAVAYGGYFCDTTSLAFTVTLPATPTRGQFVVIVDYAGTSATNNITVSPNGGKINGGSSKLLQTNRQGITFTYIDSTQGWLSTSNVYGGNPPFINAPYTASYLVVAGGGGGGSYGGGGGAGGYITGTLTFSVGTVYTAAVGGGGAGATSLSARGSNGTDSTFPGVTTATGGGGGSSGAAPGVWTGASGGSGGGSWYIAPAGGSGTPGQGNAGGLGFNNGGSGQGGGGGGAGAVGANAGPGALGGNGGTGTASSITGTPATYAGGGGGGSNGGTGGTGGTNSGPAGSPGGAGNGAAGAGGGVGTANTGGGGGGNGNPSNPGANGGSGVVILSVPTANYSGTTTGSPTITTSGSNTIITFTTAGSGTYTA